MSRRHPAPVSCLLTRITSRLAVTVSRNSKYNKDKARLPGPQKEAPLLKHVHLPQKTRLSAKGHMTVSKKHLGQAELITMTIYKDYSAVISSGHHVYCDEENLYIACSNTLHVLTKEACFCLLEVPCYLAIACHHKIGQS